MKKTFFLLGFLSSSAFAIPVAELVPAAQLPTIEAELTTAPNVPKPLERTTPAKVVVKLESLEKIMPIDKGVQFKYWTFNGSTPAPFIRVREGDMVEVQLSNPINGKMEHAIDFHSAAAPDGGAEASLTAPGKSTTFAFRAMTPGLYVYHCGAAPVGVHLGKGMFGLMLVEPKEGLPKVDKEFYIMQNEFYVKDGANPNLKVFDMMKADYELPDYVVFNGKVGALTEQNALKAKVGKMSASLLEMPAPIKYLRSILSVALLIPFMLKVVHYKIIMYRLHLFLLAVLQSLKWKCKYRGNIRF